MRASLCLASLAFFVTGCGSGAPPNTVPTCTTGSGVLLVAPVPGSTVSSTTGTIVIVSQGPIFATNVGLAVAASNPQTDQPNSPPSTVYPLFGPIASPTLPPASPLPTSSAAPSATPTATPAVTPSPSGPTPTPRPVPTPMQTPPIFSNPVYYEATGFTLSSKQTYTVEVAGVGKSACVNAPIPGAVFSTQ
jgi:hypothetical protein